VTFAKTLAAVALLVAAVGPARAESAVFAGGCFWCVEADFDKVEGVKRTTSGFSGGDVKNPTYKQVTRGGTGHYEAVEVVYDEDVVSYRELVDYFFRTIDPLDDGGQFCDRGDSYRTAIFVATPEEREAAEAAKAAAEEALGAEIVTPILDFEAFYKADSFHQNYYLSNERIFSRFGYVTKADAYEGYREGCGRDRRIAEVWGDAAGGADFADLKKK